MRARFSSLIPYKLRQMSPHMSKEFLALRARQMSKRMSRHLCKGQLEWEPPTSVSALMEIASQSRASARAHPRSPEKREHAQPSPRNRTEQLTELPPWSTRLLKILRRLQNTGAPVPYSSAHSVSTLCVTMCMRAVAVQARRVTCLHVCRE